MHSHGHAFRFTLITSMNMLGSMFRYLSNACLIPCLCSYLDDLCSFVGYLGYGLI